MDIKMIEGATRVFGAPANWDQEANGPCAALAIRDETIDGVPFMISAHAPTPDELKRLRNGALVYLGISAKVHPVVFLSVGDPPAEAAKPEPGETYVSMSRLTCGSCGKTTEFPPFTDATNMWCAHCNPTYHTSPAPEATEAKPIQYDALSSDLRALAQERVGNAIQSVLQLCQSADEAVLVNIAVLVTLGAAAAGSFAAHQGLAADAMPISELLPALFKAMEEATSEAERPH